MVGGFSCWNLRCPYGKKADCEPHKADPRREWGLAKLQCRGFIGTSCLSHCPVTVLMCFFFSCCQLLTFQVAGSADRWVTGEPGEWTRKEKVIQDLPAPWRLRNSAVARTTVPS